MAAAVGIAGCGSGSLFWSRLNSLRKKNGKSGFRVCCLSSSSSSSINDPYKVLNIHRGASESQVKKAFRQLALQYHPDVCRGSNCSIQFHQINEAYSIIMSDLRGERAMQEQRDDDPADCDLWEEWMGWEGLIPRQPLHLVCKFITH